MAFRYHSPDQLQALGEQIRAKAIQVTMDQAASYSQAQQAANNDATRSDTGQLTQVPGYSTPAGGRPDDEGNLRAYVGQACALPDPAECRPMLDALHRVAASSRVDLAMTRQDGTGSAPAAIRPLAGVAPVGETVDVIRTRMKSWEGQAALAFTNYLHQHVEAAALQREVTMSLAIALEAQLEIDRRINTDIWEIGQKTLKALESLDAWSPGSSGAKSAALLTIAGAIAAVIFAGATAGAGAAALGAAVGVEAIQRIATIWTNSAPLESKTVVIGGLTVPPVITGMQNAMTELQKGIDGQQQQLVDGLNKYTAAVHGVWNKLLIAAPDDLGALRGADAAPLAGPGGLHVGGSGGGPPVGGDHDPGLEGAGPGHGEPGGREPVGEQLLAGAQHDRVGGEPVLVDQVVCGERPDQLAAPPDADLAARLVAQLAHGGRHVVTEQVRVLPAGLGQGARRHVLGDAVVALGQLPEEALGVLVPHTPGGGEDLVRAAAEQQRLGPALPVLEDRPALVAFVHLLVVLP